jgi:tetratricopeptide (TPR) repeat protein
MANLETAVLSLFCMPIRLPSSILIAAVLLSLLTPSALQDCLAQIPSKSADAAARSAARVNEPAFDKLELFGFLAAGPNDAYASQVVQERGTNFTPDAKFIASFPSPGFQAILRSIKPRTSKTLSSDRDQAYELLHKAWDEKQNRQWAAASESFEQALQLAPNSATLHLAYAACLLFPQNYREAEAQTRQSLKLWPNNAAAHATLALSLTPQKQFAEAEAESRETLRISPKDHSAMFTLGVSLAHQQKYEEAIPFLQNALAILPKLPELKKLMGGSLIETGEVARGIDQLNLYLKAAPEDAEAHYYLGVGLRLKGSSAEAHAQFAEALRLQPNNPQYEAATHPDATQSATGTVTGPKPEDGSVLENMYANKFFGFTYQFPKGWAVLSSDATRATLATGMALMSTGDPIEVDVKKAAARMGHPLLYVSDGGSGNQAISMQTVMVSALDSRPTPGLTPRSYLQSSAQRVNQTRVQMEFSEIPEEVTVGGRSFWKNTFAVQTSAGTRYGSQFAAADKGYLLLFTFGSLDLASLSEIEKSLESIHFQERSN